MVISIRVPLAIWMQGNSAKNQSTVKINECINSKNLKKKIKKIFSLMQFTKNFFFQRVSERSCSCSCLNLWAKLIPDLWTKEGHSFTLFSRKQLFFLKWDWLIWPWVGNSKQELMHLFWATCNLVFKDALSDHFWQLKTLWKWWKMLFISRQKLFSFSWYLSFCLTFLVI